MNELAYKSFAELKALCTCTQDALDGEESACEACQVSGAIEAGIPRAVIAGDRKLIEPPDQADAYERNDPKHPEYRERMLDAADQLRKQRKEDI